jgi:hypothetical protein
VARLQEAVAADSRLGDRIFEHVWKETERLQRFGPSPGEFRCGVEQQGLVKRGDNGADLVIKKLLSMSTTSFIHCGSISRYSGDVHTGYVLSWEGFGSFLRLILRYRNLVEGNLIIPSASYSFVESIGDLYDLDEVTHANIGKDALKVNLDIDEVEQQFFETPNRGYQAPVGAVEIFLPHLMDISIETIARLRSKEQDAFIRYHRYLSEFFHDSSKISDESSIVECLQRVDEGVRETQALFDGIRKKNLYSGLGVAVGLLSAVLCLFMPHDVAEYIRAVVGGATGAASFKYLASRHQSLTEVRNADFYFPWLLHRERA